MSKIPFGAFRQIFTVCSAHNLFADSEQIPHSQPVAYFPPGTGPDGKCFKSCFSLTRKILRSFFYGLRRTNCPPPFCLREKSSRPFSVQKKAFFCLRFLYSMFKTRKYLNNRKVAEAVNRFLSNSVDPLFYLSSFQTLSRRTRCLVTATGFFPLIQEIPQQKSGHFLTFFPPAV